MNWLFFSFVLFFIKLFSERIWFVLNKIKTPNFTFLGVKLGVCFIICWFSAFIAEREGFEPAKPFRGLHAFQACLFNHSSISPRSCWNRVQRYWFFLIMQEFRLRIYIEMQCLDAITWLTRYLLGTELIQRDKTRIADVSLTRWMVSFWLKCLLFHDTALWL